jgi:hypothetical protein
MSDTSDYELFDEITEIGTNIFLSVFFTVVLVHNYRGAKQEFVN